MRTKILVVVAVVIVLGFLILMAGSMASDVSKKSLERLTYTGRVTAIISDVSGTTVWLNSNAQSIRIGSKNLQLAVGKEYQIILDGNGNLINAVILPEP